MDGHRIYLKDEPIMYWVSIKVPAGTPQEKVHKATRVLGLIATEDWERGGDPWYQIFPDYEIFYKED
jgi:hypothetical protein